MYTFPDFTIHFPCYLTCSTSFAHDKARLNGWIFS